jgi:hypothetical protein
LLEEADNVDADRASFDAQVAKIEELYAEFGPPADMPLLGGIEAMYSLHDMQSCCVTANSMAVVLLAQTSSSTRWSVD